MGSTNYHDTFIQVAEDCPVAEARVPTAGRATPSVAELQHRILTERPFELTSDELLFHVHLLRQRVPDDQITAERETFFASSRACLRASPLGRRHGWGLHHDAEGRVALVPLGSEEYRRLADDSDLRQLKAMRSTRAG